MLSQTVELKTDYLPREKTPKKRPKNKPLNPHTRQEYIKNKKSEGRSMSKLICYDNPYK